MNTIASFYDWTLPIVFNVGLFYLLVYVPFIIIPVGIILLIMAYTQSKRSQRRLTIAWFVFIVGALLATIALLLHANGSL